MNKDIVIIALKYYISHLSNEISDMVSHGESEGVDELMSLYHAALNELKRLEG